MRIADPHSIPCIQQRTMHKKYRTVTIRVRYMVWKVGSWGQKEVHAKGTEQSCVTVSGVNGTLKHLLTDIRGFRWISLLKIFIFT